MAHTPDSGPSPDKTTRSLWQTVSQDFKAGLNKIAQWASDFKNWVSKLFTKKNKSTANTTLSTKSSLTGEKSSETQSASVLKSVSEVAQTPTTTPAPTMPSSYFIPSAKEPRPELAEPLPPVESIEQIRAKEAINLDADSVKGYIRTLEASIKSLKNTWYENPDRNSFLEKQLQLGLGGKIMGEKLMKATTLIDTVNAKLKNNDKIDGSEIQALSNYAADLDEDTAFAKTINTPSSLKP